MIGVFLSWRDTHDAVARPMGLSESRNTSG